MSSVLQETNDPNNGPPVTTTYLYGLDLIASTVGSGAAVFYLTDGLGSTRELVTTGAAVVDNYHYTYDVWGGLRSAQPATMNDFRFSGEQTDVRANRGLVYLRARFYDPALGRFLNRDPVPLANRYFYVGDNPVNYVDPHGLCCSVGMPNFGVVDVVRDLVQEGGDTLALASYAPYFLTYQFMGQVERLPWYLEIPAESILRPVTCPIQVAGLAGNVLGDAIEKYPGGKKEALFDDHRVKPTAPIDRLPFINEQEFLPGVGQDEEGLHVDIRC